VTRWTKVEAQLSGDDSRRFALWAPSVERLELHLHMPQEHRAPMKPGARSYHHVIVPDATTCARYTIIADGTTARPDLASRYQPYSARGPSQVCHTPYPWRDSLWHGTPLGETAPSTCFVRHCDEPLVEAIRKGRAIELSAFEWEGELHSPKSENTLRRTRLTEGQSENNYMHCGGKAETAAVAPQDGDWETEPDAADIRWNVPGALLPTGISPFGKVGVTVASSAMLLMKERKD